MIVIRHLDSTGSECDQQIYCDIACFGVVRFGDWTNHTLKIQSSYDALNKIAESDQFNVYEDEHIIPNSHYPTIEDFLSEDSQEYCYSCKEELN
tara:strand:- start:214 stop:495 length:282 start_codon:yes stop_codon:yes gene_type:complete